MKDQQGNKDQKVIRAILVQNRDKGDRDLKGDNGAQGLREMRVTKEILVHEAPKVILVRKAHLVVVVLGLRVLKVTMDKDQSEILVLRVQKVTKWWELNLILVIEGHRSHLVVVILQTFQLFYDRMELR